MGQRYEELLVEFATNTKYFNWHHLQELVESAIGIINESLPCFTHHLAALSYTYIELH